ncbi:MAG: biopolymer transporter ExbD [Gemmatimonadetes bacterium]|nr:biopolymer transporter ExbD [Gemmatimonadota bacterium]
MATSVSSAQAGQTNVKAEPNVIPMIDIMLVLLIIFMIVTPLIANGFLATMPTGENLDKRPEGEGEVVLGIDQNGSYFLNGALIAADVLPDQLKAIYAAREEDKIMYFRAHKDLKFEKIQDAVEIARRAGVRVMAAITDIETSGLNVFGAKKQE